MESFKAGAELGLDCFLDFNEKPIRPMLNAFEKKIHKMATSLDLTISGHIRVFEKNGKLGKLLSKLEREKVRATVSRSCQTLWISRFEELVNQFYEKLEKFAAKNKLVIQLHFRCWRV